MPVSWSADDDDDASNTCENQSDATSPMPTRDSDTHSHSTGAPKTESWSAGGDMLKGRGKTPKTQRNKGKSKEANSIQDQQDTIERPDIPCSNSTSDEGTILDRQTSSHRNHGAPASIVPVFKHLWHDAAKSGVTASTPAAYSLSPSTSSPAQLSSDIIITTPSMPYSTGESFFDRFSSSKPSISSRDSLELSAQSIYRPNFTMGSTGVSQTSDLLRAPSEGRPFTTKASELQQPADSLEPPKPSPKRLAFLENAKQKQRERREKDKENTMRKKEQEKERAKEQVERAKILKEQREREKAELEAGAQQVEDETDAVPGANVAGPSEEEIGTKTGAKTTHEKVKVRILSEAAMVIPVYR